MGAIGFVGPGQLGFPMVERLAESGHEVIVHARRSEIRDALADLGVSATADLGTVAEGARLLIVCVFSDDQLAALGPTLVGALPAGAVLASHVTGRVSTLEALAATRSDIAVVDAPVSGTAADIRAGRLSVLLGGSTTARATASSVMRAYADPLIEVGDFGAALAMKLINNLLFAANIQLLTEALRLAGDLGLEPARVLTALAYTSGGSEAARHAAVAGDMIRFGQNIAPFLSKDVAACLAQAAECEVDPGLLLDVVRRGSLSIS